MENKSHALIAGIFTVALTVAIIVAAFWLNRDNKERLPYELFTKGAVSGLSPQSAVRYRGLDVGKVDTILFDQKEPGRIIVRIGVDPGTPITKSTFANLNYQGVTGLAFVQLDDNGSSKELLPTSASNPARIEIQPGLFDKLTSRGDSILVEVEEVARRLKGLLDPANQKVLIQTMNEVGVASVEIGKIGPRLEPTLARLPQVANDAQALMKRATTTVDSVDKLAANLDGLTGQLRARGGFLDTTSQGIAEIGFATSRAAGDTLPRINTLADESARTARAVARTVNALGDNPQSVLFGQPGIVPGPGEPGFVAPSAAPK